MKIAVVGLGYWGPNLVRNFLSTEGVEGVVGVDSRERQTERTKKKLPMMELAHSYQEVLRRTDIGAVVLATPISAHHPLGMEALRAGKHLLVEKPLAATTREAQELVELARKMNLTLMVDHTFVYTGAVRKIKEMVSSGRLGDILYFDSVRVNLGLFQHDSNVIWDLAPHDLSIMEYVIDKKPVAVSALGANHFNGYEDMAYISVLFPDNVIAHFHVNWLSPVKVRKILIGGTRHMLVYDDMEPSEKVKVYDKGVDVKSQESLYETLIQYRTGDMFAPHLDHTEALSLLAAEFVRCIKTGKKPTTDGTSGLNVVRILEAASQSLKDQGRLIQLDDFGG